MRGVVESFEPRPVRDEALERLRRRATADLVALDALSETDQAVVVNALAIIHHGEASDIAQLAELVEQLGGREVAQIQEQWLRVLDDPGRTLTTGLVRALGWHAWSPDATIEVGEDEARWSQVCAEALTWLLVVGDAMPGSPPVATADLLAGFSTGGILEWRTAMAGVMADPWSLGDRLAMLNPRDHAVELRVLRSVADAVRRIVEADERAAVAAFIRRAIASTGLTQRAFAVLVGTSPSRLSTYVSGTVTPSATMLLRINRTALAHRDQNG